MIKAIRVKLKTYRRYTKDDPFFTIDYVSVRHDLADNWIAKKRADKWFHEVLDTRKVMCDDFGNVMREGWC